MIKAHTINRRMRELAIALDSYSFAPSTLFPTIGFLLGIRAARAADSTTCGVKGGNG
jgi:hypothetical protein